MIDEILKKQLTFEGAENSQKFIRMFSSLYRIEVFKDGLDLILTKTREADLRFEIKIIKGWDTNVGCYLTEQNKVYNRFLNNFSRKFSHRIILRSLATNVLAHEMTHALEVESGAVLNEEFRQAIGYDMKDRAPSNLALKGEIKRTLIDGIKSYPQHQIISELFARYIEVLSTSRNVKMDGDYTTQDVMNFFVNTTKWVQEKFNPLISSKIAGDISEHTSKLIMNNAFQQEKKFTDKVDSFYKQAGSAGQKSWALNTKSNSNWQKSWNQHQQQIDDKKK